jgi:hypothetical protein
VYELFKPIADALSATHPRVVEEGDGYFQDVELFLMRDCSI